jgi:nucleoside-diphosphate-sugar epimerase
VAAGADVRALVAAPALQSHRLPADIPRFTGDICDRAVVEAAVSGAKIVVHLAGPASVAASFSDPAEFTRVHVTGTATMLDVCAAAGVRRVVYVSSAEVYGRPRSNPVRETARPRPRSPYAAAKGGAEQLVQAYAVSHRASSVILRAFSLYGPGCSPESLIGTILRQGLNSDRIRLADLEPIRDFLYVDDFARAVVLSTVSPLPQTITINIGSGEGRSVEEVARTALETMGRDLPIEADPARKRRPGSAELDLLIADISRARRVLHWVPTTDLRAGLALTAEWHSSDRSRNRRESGTRKAAPAQRRSTGHARYLVTGAQGFLGRYLVAELLRKDAACTVVGLGRSTRNDVAFTHSLSWGYRVIPAPLPVELAGELGTPRFQYVSCDILEPEPLRELLREVKPTAIFHLASGLRGDDVRSLYRTSVEGVVSLLEAMIETRSDCRLVLASSGAVYGVPHSADGSVRECDPCRPNDAYGAAKHAAERAARVVAEPKRIPIVYARLFNLVGAGQDERHVCGYMASRIAAISRKMLPGDLLVGDLSASRDFIDIRDSARALSTLAQHGQPGEIYNVGSGLETPVSAVLATLLSLAACEERVAVRIRDGTTPSSVPRHVAVTDRLGNTGFRAQYNLETTLDDLLTYYKNVVSPAAVAS